MWWNFYLSFKRGSGATYPSEQFQAVCCSINYAHLLILRGFSSAPECNSQTVVYSCSPPSLDHSRGKNLLKSELGFNSQDTKQPQPASFRGPTCSAASLLLFAAEPLFLRDAEGWLPLLHTWEGVRGAVTCVTSPQGQRGAQGTNHPHPKFPAKSLTGCAPPLLVLVLVIMDPIPWERSQETHVREEFPVPGPTSRNSQAQSKAVGWIPTPEV